MEGIVLEIKDDELEYKEGMRWDSWDALASRKWVRIEDTGRVDDEGRPILEKVDLMEMFLASIHRQI